MGGSGHGLLALGVEAGILDKTVDEDAEMGFNLKGFELDSFFLRKDLYQFVYDLLNYVVHMGASF